MPIKAKLEDGTEVDAFTQEELDAQKQAEADRVTTEKQTELDTLAAEKTELEEKLQKAQDKEQNFEKLRKKADGKEIEVNEEIKNKLDEINKRIDAVAKQPVEETVNDFIKNKVGEDKEKKELFNYYFKRLGTDAKTKEEVTKAANEALVLATNGEYKPSNDSIITSTGVTHNYREQQTGVVTEESKAIGKMFGNTEKDLAEAKKKGII